MCPFFCDFSWPQEFHDIFGSLCNSRLYLGMVTELLYPQVQRADDGLVWRTGLDVSGTTLYVVAEALLKIHPISNKRMKRLTHHVIVLEAQLAGLTGLQDLHPDKLDLCLAVLKHLLCSCEQLPILWTKWEIKCSQKYYERNTVNACIKGFSIVDIWVKHMAVTLLHSILQHFVFHVHCIKQQDASSCPYLEQEN